MMIAPPDPNVVNGWIAFLTPLALAVLAVIQLISARLSAQRGAIQAKKMDVITDVVNGRHGEVLRVAATALERVAVLTGNPGDVDNAKVAREMSDAHALQFPLGEKK